MEQTEFVEEDRFKVLCDYYAISKSQLSSIITLKHQDRRELCDSLNIDRHILRTMCDYSRYPQAMDLYNFLKRHYDHFRGLRVVDFGCLVADYALFFAEQGASVRAYDEAHVIRFVKYRFDNRNLPVETFSIPTNFMELFKSQDVAIFGEVLEHMENPIEPLEACVDARVNYIYTTCYPFGNDDYFSLSGHLRSAQLLQSDVVRLLIRYYDMYPNRDKTVVWSRRRDVS